MAYFNLENLAAIDITPEKEIIVEIDRLILRRYCKEDLLDLYEYLSDKEVVKY